MQVNDLWYPSCGAGMIHYRQWKPENKPVAVLQIIHGIVDHSERYDEFASFLVEHGFLVVAEDHMGHGRSGGMQTVRGYFNNGWFAAVEDSYTLLRKTIVEYPEVPYVLMGHSMGSYMALTILEKYPQSRIGACILCGSGWHLDSALSAGIRLGDAACRITGEKAPNKRLYDFIVGAFNLRVANPATAFDWTNSDPCSVNAFLSDPLCDFSVKSGLMRDLLTGISWTQKSENMKSIDPLLPILLISGLDDPVGLYGEGVNKMFYELLGSGINTVDMRLYPNCRHELLHERRKAEVYRDVLIWINEQVV